MSAYRIDVYEGVGKVRQIALGEAPLTIGRTQSCDVVVGGPGVSRLHCQVISEGGTVRLENQSSTKSGTRVNGKRVKDSVVLAAGDEITVGDAVMVFQAQAVDAADAAPPLPSERGAEPEEGEPQAEAEAEAPEAEAPEPQAKERDRARSRDRAREREEREIPSDPNVPLKAQRDDVQEFLERKRLEKNFKLAVGLLALAIFSGGVAFVGAKLISKQTAKKSGAEDGPEVPRVAPPPDGGARRVGRAELGNPTDADQAWLRVQVMSPDAVPEGLVLFAEMFPDDPRADDALYFSQQLKSARKSAGSKKLGAVIDAMLAEARRLAAAKDPSRAHAVCGLVEGLLPGSPQAKAARKERMALRKAAEAGVTGLRDRAQALSARLGPVQAILLVLEEQTKLRGLGQDEGLDELVADLERQAAERMQALAQPELALSAEALTVEQKALDKALLFDFNAAWKGLDTLLLLSLSDEARLRAHWLRHQVRGLQLLFEAALAASKGPAEKRPTLTVGGKLRARLLRADAEYIYLAPVMKEGSGELKWRWGRVTPYQIQELFSLLGERDWNLGRAKAFHAFRTGLDDLGVNTLIPFSHQKRLRGDVFSFYSLATGVPLPEGGFVVFEGRFVAPAEKDRILAARKEAREAARALASAAREEKEEGKLKKLLGRVLALMDEGHYTAGRDALAKIAERHADVPGVGDVARARLESPMLRRRDVRITQKLGRNGPAANRLDIYLFGDGFVLNDQKQVQFDRYADNAVKACQLQDFFKEYDQYINYWAVNLTSKEEGLTKDGESKDTALGTEINGGVYTVGSGGPAMFRLLERWWPGEHDRLAVSVGNDFATVATGGGGTVAVAKTMVMVTPHELGHAYGGLGDEYDQEPGPNPGPPRPYSGPARVIAPNIVAASTAAEARKVVPWKDWVDTVGTGNWSAKPIDVFEGANRQPRGYWRPQRSCVMRDSGTPFCAVCMEIMVKRLYRYVKPIDQTWPEETELTADGGTITFRALVMKPKTHDLFVHWRRKTLELFGEAPAAEEEPEDPADPDGTRVRKKTPPSIHPKKQVKDVSGKLQVIEGNYVHYIKVRPRELAPGRYEVSAEVWDPTPWVRESKKVLSQTHRWILTVPRK